MREIFLGIDRPIKRCSRCTRGQMVLEDRIRGQHPQWECVQCGNIEYVGLVPLPYIYAEGHSTRIAVLEQAPENPKIGDKVNGTTLRLKNHTSYVWAACIGCGHQRWVKLVRGEAKYKLCKMCGNAMKRVIKRCEHTLGEILP